MIINMNKGIKIIAFLVIVMLVVSMQTNEVFAAKKNTKSKSKTVDLVIFAGQSNMEGPGGNPALAPEIAKGTGYEFVDGINFTGLKDLVEPIGMDEKGVFVGRNPGGTMASAFAKTYYESTGVPVMAVYAAKGGTSIDGFWKHPLAQEQFLSKYTDTLNWCKKNGVTVRHKYCVWLQGESDVNTPPETYINDISVLFAPLIDNGLEQVFIVLPGNWKYRPTAMDNVIATQKMLCENSPYFTLGTGVLHSLSEDYLVDQVHYNQVALNLAGVGAAQTASQFKVSGK